VNAREAKTKTGSVLMDSNLAFVPSRASVFYSMFGQDAEPNNWFIELPNGN